MDRTKQLLELDLAHRQGAITRLQADFQNESLPWQAYSLGVLYGAEGDFQNMNRWFERCHKLSTTLDPDMGYVRLSHWRDEAQAGDQALEEQDYSAAISHLEKALLAAPEKKETRERLVEARVLAFGPQLEEIRTLVQSGHPAAVYRFLEQAAKVGPTAQQLATRIRLASQLAGSPRAEGDDLAAYVVAELSRLDGDWAAMDTNYRLATQLNPGQREREENISRAREEVGLEYLHQALVAWSDHRVPLALAKLDTADLVDPDRADIVRARRNIVALDGARTPAQVARTLKIGDLDQRWLEFWMSRLYTTNRLRGATMVANELLQHSETLNPVAKSQALRVRVAFSRSIGNLDQARDDLRELLQMGKPLPLEAVILGDVLLEQSHYAEAGHWYHQARQWGDDSVSLVLKQARVAFSQNRLQDMEHLANQVLQRQPDNTEAQQMLAAAQRSNP